MPDTFKENALSYHEFPKPGKLEIRPTKPLSNKLDLALAYSPGVAFACQEIEQDPRAAAKMTARGNLVAVISNGTAVLGLGAIGALASKPVMEGKAVLFKKFANVDVFDIEINETEVDKLVDIIASLEPTFGGINLEDIKAPECFLVERALKERMNIPVFHDDQHGTAIVSAAAIYNGLRIVEKKIEDVKLVVAGAGAASIACTDLLVSMGLKPENVYMADRNGIIYKGRAEGMNPWKEKYANDTPHRTLQDALVDADIFMGLSGPGLLSGKDIKPMARDPLILAMSNPVPEIMPEEAREARPDAIIATGRSDYANQVNNVLCFPFVFRGALDCGATTINEAMKQAAVKAIADLATKESVAAVAAAYRGEELKFGRDYLIPKPFDPRLIEDVPLAVVKAAMESGVAERPVQDFDAYRRRLHSYVSSSSLFMQPVIDRARMAPARIVYAEGENDDVIHAIQSVIDAAVARPILIGRQAVIEQKIADFGLRISAGTDFDVFNASQADHHDRYWRHYHKQMAREGVSVEAAKTIVTQDATVLAAMMVELGDADGMICGKVGRYDKHLKKVGSLLSPGQHHHASVCALLLEEGPLFIADPFVQVDPTEDQVVAITEDAMGFVRKFGITPKVALLSHSNFGTYEDEGAYKMKRAVERLQAKYPEAEIDGEMHSMSALNVELRQTICAHSKLEGRANLLIMPNMDTASIALGLIRSLTGARMVGPFLTRMEKPAHILIPSVSPRGILNMTALAVADIHDRKQSSAG